MSLESNGKTSELLESGNNDDIIRAFLGKNADYYIHKWEKAKIPEKRAGLNWAGLFAGIFWLGYRKMYKILIMVFGLFLVIDIVQFFVAFDLSRGVGIGISAVLCGNGNSIYYNHMNRKINELKHSSSTKDELVDSVKAVGGASWKGVGIAIALFITYIIAISILSVVLDMLLK